MRAAMLTTAAALVAAIAVPHAVAQDKKPEWKERAEYDLYDSAAKETNPATRLATLNKWRANYSDSGYADVRQDMFLITYQQLVQQQPARAREGFNIAVETLATRPNSWRALSAVVSYPYLFSSVSETELDAAQKGAARILDHLDEIYAPSQKPAEIKDAEWARQKPEMKVYAQRTLAWIEMQRKNNAGLEREANKALALDPNQAQVSYWLASAIAARIKDQPERYPVALYHYARATGYDGPGALIPADRQKIRDFLTNAYTKYHGSADGMDALIASARTSAVPPSDWKGVESAAEIARRKQLADEEEARKNPRLALWRNLRRELTGEKGGEYFESSMRGALLPGTAIEGVTKFKGKLVGLSPDTKPRQLMLSIEGGPEADVMLKLDNALPGKMDIGSELEFEGIASSFTRDPFMVIFEVEKSKLVGWAGKNAPGPVRKKAAAAVTKK
jgi:hypothetical protein